MSKYKDLGEEYAEIGVDKVIEEASKYLPALQLIGEETPIVKTAIAAVSIPKTISDAILANKVKSFLYGADLSEEKIRKFKDKFTKTKQEKLWKTVFHSVNSHDDEMKSQIIGKLFNALIDDYIDDYDFIAMTHATNNMNISLLDDLRAIYHLNPQIILPTNILITFSYIGLLNTNNTTVGKMNGGGPEYPPNNLGWKYVGIVNDFPMSGVMSIRIGEGELYEEIDKDGMITGASWPLDYMIQEGLIYRDVLGFAIDNSENTLIDEETGLPHIFEGHPVTPEQEAYIVASNHFRKKIKGPAELFVRIYDRRQVNAFVFEIAEPVAGTVFQSSYTVEQTVNKLDDEKKHFYSEVIQMIHTFQDENGSNHEEWISAYDNKPDDY